MATETTAPGPSPWAELLRGDQCLAVESGRLRIEDVDLGAVAARFGTPLYVHSERQLRANARAFREAFGDHWSGGVLVMPSIKANLSLALRRILSEEGLGCDTVGRGELEAAVRGGVEPGLISLNGPIKDEALIRRGLELGARITVDSVAELERVRELARASRRRATVRLRARPWLALEQQAELAHEPVSIRVAAQRYKPGIPTEQLLALPPELARAEELRISGLMVHIGRLGREPEIWAELARWTGSLACQLSDAWPGWRPTEIDLGGGFPVPRDPTAGGHEEPAPPLADYAAAIAGGLGSALAEGELDPASIRLEVEPGRALYGNSGVHLTAVRHLKRQRQPLPLAWVETDSSELFLADVAFEHNRWTPVVVNRAGEELTETADLVGASCNADIIVADASLPRVEVGDVIAILDTGAYQDVGASNFNAMPRPATVLVSGAEVELIKRRETIAEIFSRDLVPSRLAAAEAPAARVRGLDHVSVSSGDLERSLAFYRDLLGIPLLGQGELEGAEVAAIARYEEAHVRFADLDLGDGRILELLQFLTPAGAPLEPELYRPGSGHLALRVDDADAVHAALREAGVAVRSEPVELDEPGPWHRSRCFYATDPDGVTVEIIERPATTGAEGSPV